MNRFVKYLLYPGLLLISVMGPWAVAAESEGVLPSQADSALRIVPGRNTEVVDAAGHRYRLKPIVPLVGPQHSLSLEFGAFPGCVNRPLIPGSEGGCDDYSSWLWPGEYPGERRYYEGPLRVTGGIGISYGYRVRRWFEVGASLTYSGFYQNLYYSRNAGVAGRVRDHYVTLMPYARFSWLNRRSVRLYSSLHLGIQANWQKSYFYPTWNNYYLAAHLTPFGIRVGRRLFGYGEVGVGMRGVFVLGIGYGIGAKSDK